jgi:hypothetical protein
MKFRLLFFFFLFVFFSAAHAAPELHGDATFTGTVVLPNGVTIGTKQLTLNTTLTLNGTGTVTLDVGGGGSIGYVASMGVTASTGTGTTLVTNAGPLISSASLQTPSTTNLRLGDGNIEDNGGTILWNMSKSGSSPYARIVEASTSSGVTLSTSIGVLNLSGTIQLNGVAIGSTYVPQTQTVNGHPLNAPVVVSGSDITTGVVAVANGGTGAAVPLNGGWDLLGAQKWYGNPNSGKRVVMPVLSQRYNGGGGAPLNGCMIFAALYLNQPIASVSKVGIQVNSGYDSTATLLLQFYAADPTTRLPTTPIANSLLTFSLTSAANTNPQVVAYGSSKPALPQGLCWVAIVGSGAAGGSSYTVNPYISCSYDTDPGFYQSLFGFYGLSDAGYYDYTSSGPIVIPSWNFMGSSNPFPSTFSSLASLWNPSNTANGGLGNTGIPAIAIYEN